MIELLDKLVNADMLSAVAVIVVVILFMKYIVSRDTAAAAMADRCHETHKELAQINQGLLGETNTTLGEVNSTLKRVDARLEKMNGDS